MNLIEQVEEILRVKTKTPDPGFIVSVHQINDNWFVAEFTIHVKKYKNWFDHLRGKGKLWQFRVTVPYFIKDLVRARKISEDELAKALRWDVDEIMSLGLSKRAKRSQLRKWGKVYQDVDKKLTMIFCACEHGGSKDDKRHNHREGRGF